MAVGLTFLVLGASGATLAALVDPDAARRAATLAIPAVLVGGALVVIGWLQHRRLTR